MLAFDRSGRLSDFRKVGREARRANLGNTRTVKLFAIQDDEGNPKPNGALMLTDRSGVHFK